MKPTEIRKYTNRKLYDVGRASYISMLDLSDMVAGGTRVRVTCDRTGDDITLPTLSRALYERVKDSYGGSLKPAMLEGLFVRVLR
jgi:polyhydroxyalkanoate synthesis regulator protein